MNAIDFVIDTYVKRTPPSFYQSYFDSHTNEHLYENVFSEEYDLNKSVLIVEDVPTYLKIVENEVPENFKIKKIKSYPGFMIHLENIESIEAYLCERFGRNSRYKLRRDMKKLEHCFDIEYKMFHGDNISKEHYDYIFDEFYKLLEIRSLQKGIKKNRNLATKDYYHEKVYPMIMEKKASMFVIFNKNKPIDICLNFHLNNAIFQFIRTYDINFSKFNTGYTDLIKQLEWCIQNKIRFIVFSKGDFYWKRRWCNTVYDYYYHVYWDPTSVLSTISAKYFSIKKSGIQLLRDKGVIAYYHHWLDKYKKLTDKNSDKNFKIIKKPENFENHQKTEIDLSDKTSLLPLKIIYDFLYENDERETDIKLYRINEMRNSFYLKGIKSEMLFQTSD